MIAARRAIDPMPVLLSLRQGSRGRGQGTVWFALVVMVLLLMIGVLADGGLFFATYRRAALLADSAASAGAGVLDLAALRADPSGPPRLDTARAAAVAAAYVSRHEPDAIPEVQTTPDRIIVRVTLSVPVIIVHAFGQDIRQVVAESDAHPESGLAAPGG
jgi:hypothetical protein